MEAVKRYAAMKDSGVEWIGEIPASWKIIRLKYLFSIKKDIAGELGYTVLSVTQKGILPKKMDDKGQFSLDYSKYQKVHAGEYVMNHMDLLTGWIDISQYSGVTSPDYRVFYKTSCDIDTVFYKYFFQFCYSGRVFYGLGQGVAGFGRWRLPSDMFLNFQLPVPPLHEQNAIASYLDEKCSAIDDIIASARASIDDYKQLKASTIYEAVTKGLNHDVEMKESGVEWIGKIPRTWTTLKIKHLASNEPRSFIDGDWINAPEITSDGIRYFTTGNIGQGFFKEQGNGYISEETFLRLDCTEVHAGDLIISRLNTPVGRACIIPKKYAKCIVAVDNVVLRPSDNYSKTFLMYSMSSDRYSEFTQLLARGTTMQRISRTQLGNVFLPIPPLSEQQAIADYLDTRCAEIDSLIAEKEALIADLEAYKKSLIYECVTGKRRVTEDSHAA